MPFKDDNNDHLDNKFLLGQVEVTPMTTTTTLPMATSASKKHNTNQWHHRQGPINGPLRTPMTMREIAVDMAASLSNMGGMSGRNMPIVMGHAMEA
jgi:hypothetical protein